MEAVRKTDLNLRMSLCWCSNIAVSGIRKNAEIKKSLTAEAGFE